MRPRGRPAGMGGATTGAPTSREVLQVEIRRLIEQACAVEGGALGERDAKTVLKAYGIPTVPEDVVTGPEAAVAAAARLGFPVVLKGHGAHLLHKTEHGLVHLNLPHAEAVRQAARAILADGRNEVTEILVQPHVRGQREFMAGFSRDPQFGPVVLFGLGGIFTEALGDTSLRLAPLEPGDAEDMLLEIRAHKLLGAFRGEAAADHAALVKIIEGLSRLAQEFPQVAEVDINPLRVTPSGEILALDALLVCRELPAAAKPLPPVSPEDIGGLFHPRSVAFVGASAQFGKWGHMLFVNTVGAGFEGAVHLVNPRGGRIAGRRAHTVIGDVPGPVDLAVVTIPARRVPDLIPQLRAKGVKHLLLITSGFGETGSEGRRQEKELVRQAREAGLLILGPNTMGICNPHIGFYCTGSAVQPAPGHTAVVAQSGNMGVQLLAFAEQQGIGVRGFAGSGNEAMITIEDYLEGFEADELTHTIMLYVESVKNGRRFFESARRLGRRKPVVLLKGGQSRAGLRAAASHTGAMTTDAAVFNAMCRQAGIVKVNHPMELLDLAAAFDALPLPRGNRVAIMTLGGGWGVVTADLCERYGLSVPDLSPDLIERFDGLLPAYWSRSNPVDLVGENDPSLPLTVMEELLRWDGCDAVINLGIHGRRLMVERLATNVSKADPDTDPALLESIRQTLAAYEIDYRAHAARLVERYDKPIFGVSLMTDKSDRTVYDVPGARVKSVFYETPERAVRALAQMVDYQRFRMRPQDSER
jgi:acyl-CoA synthetase (NDP forming)